MIIPISKEELDQIIEHLEIIEEDFWLNHRYYSKASRLLIKNEFIHLYSLLNDLRNSDGKQLEIKY